MTYFGYHVTFAALRLVSAAIGSLREQIVVPKVGQQRALQSKTPPLRVGFLLWGA